VSEDSYSVLRKKRKKNIYNNKFGREVGKIAQQLKVLVVLGVVAHAFNPNTWEAEAGGFLSSRPAWSTK
jgi:major histocompatibility complex class I